MFLKFKTVTFNQLSALKR